MAGYDQRAALTLFAFMDGHANETQKIMHSLYLDYYPPYRRAFEKLQAEVASIPRAGIA